MERKEILRNLGIQETVLDNGFKILTKHIPGMKTIQLGIAARFGSIYENDEIGGIAHFLEHMVFKGTKTKSLQDVLQILDELGSISNAYTDWDHVSYYITTSANYFSKAIDILSDFVLNPVFNQKELDTERKVIIQEIAMCEDDPWIASNELLYQGLYEKNPVKKKIIGTPENVRRFTREDFLRVHQERYMVNNLFLVVVGGIKHGDAVGQAKKYFGNKASKNVPILENIPEEAIKHKRLIVDKSSLTEAKLRIGFRAPHFRERDYYVMRLIASILGGGWTSRLIKEIREKRGWSYATAAYCESSLVHDILKIYTNLPNGKIVEAESVIIKEIAKVKNKRVPDEEVKRHIDRLITQYVIKQEKERSDFWFNKIVKAEIRDHFEAILNGVKPFRKITQEDILRVANRYLDIKNYVLAVVKGGDK